MPRAVTAAYFVVQGVLTLAWWALLLARPESARLFFPPSWPSAGLFAFMAPDLALVAGGSIATGALLFRRSPHAPYAAWAVAGSVTYAALYCLDAWLATGEAVWAVVFMIPAAVVSGAIAVAVSRS